MSCIHCGDALNPKRRGQRCAKCYKKREKRAREEEPERKISYRFHKWCNKHGITKRTLWCEQTIHYVLERWERKCAITGETDLRKLTIVPFSVSSDKVYCTMDVDDLVLVSSESALALSKLVAERRELAFPASVRQRISQDASLKQ